ncbi:solute carrier family 22 member 15-like [Dendronephthya gigantea]|uniref:solute carrier family 22 member 15-like n=1 Tax=Dendronephthya gigantea TaxID=151771 RepID=UPI001069DF78|nr:solute carrier family 22 member 15-like [Dendronephthya gigantea]
MAYLFRDWRQMTVVVSLPGVLYVMLFAKSIPESPRWLLAKDRISEAEVILTKIARRNGTTFDKKLIQTEPRELKSRSKNYGILTLLTHKCLRLKMVILMFVWLINSMVYYGLSFNSKNMEGDRYLNFFLSGLVEIPSYLLAVPMIDRLGRQKSLFLTVTLGSIGCLVCAFGPAYFATATANVGKFGISSSFGILYVYSAELIPTAVRNFAMGTCSMTARIGGILAPFIVTLAIVDKKLPMLLFAGTGIFAGLIGLFLPETLNHPIAETLDELETSQENQKLVTIL